MKYKTLILMILIISLLIGINTVNAEIHSGNIQSSSITDTEYNSVGGNHVDHSLDALYISQGAEVKNIHSVYITIPYTDWDGGTAAYAKSDVIYKESSIIVGEGYVYYWKMDTDSDGDYDYVYIKCYFENGLDLSSGSKIVDIEGDIITEELIVYEDFDNILVTDSVGSKVVIMGTRNSATQMHKIKGVHTSKIHKLFYNSYNYWYNENEELFHFNLTRNVGNTSQIIITNDDGDLLNETSLKSTFLEVLSDDIANDTWNFYALDNIGYEHNLVFDFITVPDSIIPTLTTDKLLYNTSEQITISFTNIDEIEGYTSESLSLYILYSVVDDYKDYDAKYMLHLYGDRRDETFTLNTSFLTPENQYHLAVCVDGDFHNIDDALIISDTFYVYDDNEYLTSSCNPEGNCYTYNNNDITIFYKINNNSDIIIKDNDGTIIQTYYNIINEGEINYHIPNDENKLNSYPNWIIYLNNTEYETNYSTDVTVYWSLFVTPTPTPIYTVDIPDENVTEQIDQLKEESKPIFDLIYGLTTLVIDNPDYDNDNIIDEHEINNWFNSLIPLGILLLLVVLYMGLKKRG